MVWVGVFHPSFHQLRGLDPEISNISLRVHDHGTPDKDFFELEGYLSCKARSHGAFAKWTTGNSLGNDDDDGDDDDHDHDHDDHDDQADQDDDDDV